jgi:thiamine transporter
MKQDPIRNMAYMAFYAALYVVLWYVSQFIPFLVMPDGGSIELQYIALFIASYHLGWQKGLGVGALSWVLVFIFGGEKFFVAPIQYCLDYFIPLAVVAIACIFAGHSKYNYAVGVVVSIVFKWLSNVISGVFFYFPEGSAAGSLPAWSYSVAYNTWYNLATMIVCIIIVPALVAALKKTNTKFSV